MSRGRTRFPALISNQPQYSMLWRVIGGRGRAPTSARSWRISQVVWSPIAQGVLTGRYRPGEQPPSRVACHR